MIFASVMPLAWKAEPDARIAEMMKTEKAGSVEEVRAQVHECQLTEQNVFPASESFVATPRFRAPRDGCYPDRPQQAAELDQWQGSSSVCPLTKWPATAGHIASIGRQLIQRTTGPDSCMSLSKESFHWIVEP